MFALRYRQWLRETRGDSEGFRLSVALIISCFALFPLAQAASDSGSLGNRALTIGCALVFVVGYCAMILLPSWTHAQQRRSWVWTQLAALGAMFACALALCLAEGPGWAYLFTYCAATATLLGRRALALAAIALSAVLAAAVPLAAGQRGATALGNLAGVVGVGLIMWLLRDIGERNDALTRARSDLARLAVAEERERFARDLHDLLGHSLSVIALKAELAGRLLAGDAERAAAEVADIESVARGALHEVREAVGGYRRPTLDGELEGARVALDAAGVRCEIDWDHEPLDPEAESVLAWAVREGATNVIRHSAAHRCVVRVLAHGDLGVVEVLDDGPAPVKRSAPVAGDRGDDGAPHAGHGLAGLRERVTASHGEMAAGPLAGGGYRLSVSVPRSGP